MVGSARATQIESALRAAGDPARAAAAKRYLKSELEHVGASVPTVRGVVKAQIAAGAAPGHDELIGLVRALWACPVHECRLAAVELLARRSRDLGPADIGLVEELLRQSGTWALVDPLATSVAGALVAAHSELAATLDRWSRDEDFWIRRSALLALLPPLRRGAGDFDRFGRYADAMLDEREFFIRKAIGWVLRDTARRRPDLVYAWLAPRAARASGLTIREAQKRLSPQQRAALQAARAGDQGAVRPG